MCSELESSLTFLPGAHTYPPYSHTCIHVTPRGNTSIGLISKVPQAKSNGDLAASMQDVYADLFVSQVRAQVFAVWRKASNSKVCSHLRVFQQSSAGTYELEKQGRTIPKHILPPYAR